MLTSAWTLMLFTATLPQLCQISPQLKIYLRKKTIPLAQLLMKYQHGRYIINTQKLFAFCFRLWYTLKQEGQRARTNLRVWVTLTYSYINPSDLHDLSAKLDDLAKEIR